MINYGEFLNESIINVKPSGIRKFFSIAEEMENVISLGVGEPDFKTPWHIRDTAIEYLNQGKTRYTANAGLIELRHEIADFYKRKYNVEYDGKSEVLVTVGGSEGIDMAIRTIISPGDEVLVIEPSFVCYSPLVSMAGGKVVTVTTKAENKFKLHPKNLKVQ